MIKKLLILSLAAVMLSTAAFANGILLAEATYAAEAEEVTENFDYTKYEILRVTQATETTQKITKPTSNVTGGKTSSWYLVKVDIEKNWGSFTSITSAFRMTAAKGQNYSYLTSLTKTDYDAAVTAVGTTVDNFLGEPRVVAADTEKMWKNGSGFSSNTSKQTLTLTVEEGLYTYSDGCLYFAFQSTSDNTTYPYVGLRVEDTSYFKTVVKGTKVETPPVDDFSDAEIDYDNTTGTYTIATTTTTAEAYLIIASYTGTTMNDVELVPVNAATAARNDDGAISGTLDNVLDEGTIKIFLLDKATLAPATAVQ